MSNTPLEIIFKDSYQPSVKTGDWEIKITQTLADATFVSFSTLNQTFPKTQKFSINAPGFTLEKHAVLASYPPPNSKGSYENQLPHIVLRSAPLPWERRLSPDSPPSIPWLGLILFSADEIITPDTDEYGAFTTTVGQFLLMEGVERSRIKSRYTENPDDVCKYIRLSPELAGKVLPYADELPFLAHCRVVNTEPSPEIHQREDGMSTILMANRFPKSLPNTPVKNIVHLVSFEGLAAFLSPQGMTKNDIVLPSLAAWSFESVADLRSGFCQQLADMAEHAYANGSKNADPLRLRLPFTAKLPENARRRLSEGYLPLTYYARTGEQSFAWYRSPLSPVPVTKWDQKKQPFFSADSAMIYDEANGVFDLSLASAWEAGRMVALSDKTFVHGLLDIRAAAQMAADSLINRVGSNYFEESTTSGAASGKDSRATLNSMLMNQLFVTLAQPAQASAQQSFLRDNPDWENPVGAVRGHIDDNAVKERIRGAIEELLLPASAWLARLFLLYRVPFEHLVPLEEMLPEESLRFFYVDETWLSALMDGAMSVGLDSSRQTNFSIMTKALVFESTMRELSVMRKKKYREAESAQAPDCISGFLIRSSAVRDWPNFEVHPSASGTELTILRLDHLSPDLLICLLDGIPDKIMFKVPPDGVGFGTRLNRILYLRKASDRGGKPIGTPLMAYDLNTPGCMRTGDVLNISPKSQSGLAGLLKGALGDDNLPVNGAFTPGVFALQLELIREAIEFHTYPSNGGV